MAGELERIWSKSVLPGWDNIPELALEVNEENHEKHHASWCPGRYSKWTSTEHKSECYI
jgi:hypothetical protein